MSLPDPLVRLIEELQRLPGIGPKGAQRLAFHLLRTPREQTDRLVEAVRDVKERVTYCSICNNITDADPCLFCSNDARDPHVICVVEEPQNITAIDLDIYREKLGLNPGDVVQEEPALGGGVEGVGVERGLRVVRPVGFGQHRLEIVDRLAGPGRGVVGQAPQSRMLGQGLQVRQRRQGPPAEGHHPLHRLALAQLPRLEAAAVDLGFQRREG